MTDKQDSDITTISKIYLVSAQINSKFEPQGGTGYLISDAFIFLDSPSSNVVKKSKSDY